MTNPDVIRVYTTMCRFGLGLDPGEVPEREERYQMGVIERLLQDYTSQDLVEMIRYGMPRVWPYSEDGRPFDAKDLQKNALKARGEVGRMRRAGNVPTNIQNLNRSDS